MLRDGSCASDAAGLEPGTVHARDMRRDCSLQMLRMHGLYRVVEDGGGDEPSVILHLAAQPLAVHILPFCNPRVHVSVVLDGLSGTPQQVPPTKPNAEALISPANPLPPQYHPRSPRTHPVASAQPRFLIVCTICTLLRTCTISNGH